MRNQILKRGASRRQTASQSDRPSPRKSVTGVSQSKAYSSDKLASYWRHHRASCLDSLARLLAEPLQSLMTVLVVAIALALPVILLLGISNLQSLSGRMEASPKISLYLNVRARDQAVEQLRDRLSGLPDVERVEFISAQQALEDFQRSSGLGDVLASLSGNPLPAVLVVTPASVALDSVALSRLKTEFEQEAIVDSVNLDMDWVQRLQQIMLLSRKLALALAILLGLGVLLVLGNTIRLAIENRRSEIVVIKLVGATNGFVRRPFLYTGGWYGCLGGALAVVLVYLGYLFVQPAVLKLSLLYQSEFVLQGLGLYGAFKLLLIGAVLGLLGAWLAVWRHLAQIEPE
ncbi:MAG: cell division protein [Alteromonadaceae bacterium]|nr:MAG: cell division protein [Alteromonadaceae bacterium]